MKKNQFISESAQKKIFDQKHNYKSIGALYGWEPDQTWYRIKVMKQDPEFAKEFGKKISELTYNQKLLLYEEWGEIKKKK